MAEFWSSVVALALLAGSAAVGVLVRPFLPEAHRTHETMEFIRLAAGGLLTTFAALVLGLLTASVKSSFDTADDDIRGLSVEIIQLDHELRTYGPPAEPIRTKLNAYLTGAIATTWPEEESSSPNGRAPLSSPARESELESPALGEMLHQIEAEIRGLNPEDAFHQKLAARCLALFDRITDTRWKLIGEAHSSISAPFYWLLLFWLMIIFLSFGLSAPRNPLAFTIMSLCALSIASVIYVILELDGPLQGYIKVSSQPMRAALAHLNDLNE